MTGREIGIAAAIVLAGAGAASAQSAGSDPFGDTMPASAVTILSVTPGQGAVIEDGLGERYLCELAERRAYVEIRGCRPLRLSSRVGGYVDAQGKVLRLFERNDCTLSYDQLRSALSSASEATRKAVGEVMADMTAAGQLVDEESRGRARLVAGESCEKR